MEQMSMFGNSGISKADIREKARKGMRCSCCGRYVKIYRRKLHAEMVVWLAGLYSLDSHCCNRGYYTTVDILKKSRHLRAGGTNGTLLVHWGLIEKIPQKNRGGALAGSYRITDEGVSFLKGEKRVPSFVDLFDGELIEVGQDMVSVRQCLGDKFDYDELMQ